MNMNNTIIQVQNLTVKFQNNLVLDNVNCKIKAGELVHIFGANGSGKTTLIKTILGIVKPNKGTIKIYNKPLNQNIISKHIGYVPQYTNIPRDFPISVSELIELECNAANHCPLGVTGHLEVLNSENLNDKKIDSLSGGEFQKVLIARALTTNPDIIILDEPINNLDEKTQHDLINFIHKLNEESKKTILMITHDQSALEYHNDNRVLLVRDHKIHSGKASKIFEQIRLH